MNTLFNGRPLKCLFWAFLLVLGINGRADAGLTDSLVGHYTFPTSETLPLYQRVQSSHVVLFLHGMNSTAETWNDAASQYYEGICADIFNGRSHVAAKANAQNSYCYRVNFGAYDATSTNKGLENAWDYAQALGATSGDFSTFNQLGAEVNKAINAIKRQLPNPQILFVAHSRGGLAARAFLQQPAYSQNKANVVGLITTGTPHKGSRLGRIYKYMVADMMNADGSRKTDADSVNDWHVVGFLNGSEESFFFTNPTPLDARRPVIDYLADNNALIKKLNKNQSALPAIKYGAISYANVDLGQLGLLYQLFAGSGADIFPKLSTPAEIAIKGHSADGNPKPSSDYMGDGIVTVQSQEALAANAKKKRYTPFFHIYHTDEPKQTADIADMTCRLGFAWLTSCPLAAQTATAQSAQRPSTATEAIPYDYDALTALPITQLWQDWLAVVIDDNHANSRAQLATALGIKLRSNDDTALYANIKQRLLDTNAAPLERVRLAHLLAEIATPPALALLTDAFLTNGLQSINDCKPCSTALSRAILTVAGSLPEQPRRTGLSAVLENAWLSSKQQHADTLALSLAKLGTPHGVGLLLAAVEKTGATLPSAQEKTLNPAQKQAIAAFKAMDAIINPDSERVLESAFMSHHANEAVFIAAGTGLANLGRADAAQLVLQRPNELPDSALLVGQRWLSRLSGKINKTTLRHMNKAIGLPNQPLLRQQMQDMVEER
ncbi:MAG: hypothetical protein PHR16_07465 [Methylovulum sp.]|nr:hypothetical protein [Methylovulum sp.]